MKIKHVLKTHQSRHPEAIAAVVCLLAMGGAAFAATNLPVITLLAPDSTALEGTSSGSFTLIRDSGTNAALAVDLKIVGTASNGVDYVQITNKPTIPAGFLAVDILIQPIVVNQGNKTVVLTVETNAAYVVGHKHQATVHIVDDAFNIPPPTVTLTSPANGSVFGSPATINLEATASDPEVPIIKVSFYSEDHFLGQDTNSPYTFVWTNVPPGHYSVFARAVDQVGQSVFSSGANITVTNSTPFPHGPPRRPRR